jgi:hypothetical protein
LRACAQDWLAEAVVALDAGTLTIVGVRHHSPMPLFDEVVHFRGRRRAAASSDDLGTFIRHVDPSRVEA